MKAVSEEASRNVMAYCFERFSRWLFEGKVPPCILSWWLITHTGVSCLGSPRVSGDNERPALACLHGDSGQDQRQGSMLGVVLVMEFLRYVLHLCCAPHQLCDFGKSLNLSESSSPHQQNGDVKP